MAFNMLFKASNVWRNKCPKHLFTDMLYKAKNNKRGCTHTLTHYTKTLSYITLFLKEIN